MNEVFVNGIFLLLVKCFYISRNSGRVLEKRERPHLSNFQVSTYEENYLPITQMLEKALKSVEAAPWNLAMVSFSPLVKIRVWPSIKYLKYTYQNEGTVHFAVIIFPHFEKLKRSRKALYSSFHIPQQWTFQVEEKQKVRRVRCGAWLAFNSPVLGHLALENVSIQRPNHGTISLARLSNKILRKSVTGTHLDLDQLWSNMTRIQVGLWFLIPLMACLCFAKEEVRDGKLCKFCDCLHVFC